MYIKVLLLNFCLFSFLILGLRPKVLLIIGKNSSSEIQPYLQTLLFNRNEKHKDIRAKYVGAGLSENKKDNVPVHKCSESLLSIKGAHPRVPATTSCAHPGVLVTPSAVVPAGH